MNRKEQIKKMIREVVAKNLPQGGYKLFIFGSQANQPELIKADIDVGIDTGFKLAKSIRAKIRLDLEDLPTLYFFDFVDFQNVEDYFKEVALTNIEAI